MDFALTSDHCRVLTFLWGAGRYTPDSDPPILGDEHRTQNALRDLVSLSEPLVETVGKSFCLTAQGIALCCGAAWLEQASMGAAPAETANQPMGHLNNDEDEIVVDTVGDQDYVRLPIVANNTSQGDSQPRATVPAGHETLAYHCPYCDSVFRPTVVETNAGHITRCTHCDRNVLIPLHPYEAQETAPATSRRRVVQPSPRKSPPPQSQRTSSSVSSASPSKKNNPFAVTGFVLGITSVFLYFVGIIPILGIIFSAIGLGTYKPDIHKNRWMAGVGLGLSITFTLMLFWFYSR